MLDCSITWHNRTRNVKHQKFWQLLQLLLTAIGGGMRFLLPSTADNNLGLSRWVPKATNRYHRLLREQTHLEKHSSWLLMPSDGGVPARFWR